MKTLSQATLRFFNSEELHRIATNPNYAEWLRDAARQEIEQREVMS